METIENSEDLRFLMSFVMDEPREKAFLQELCKMLSVSYPWISLDANRCVKLARRVINHAFIDDCKASVEYVSASTANERAVVVMTHESNAIRTKLIELRKNHLMKLTLLEREFLEVLP